jgi:hypothetical protein
MKLSVAACACQNKLEVSVQPAILSSSNFPLAKYANVMQKVCSEKVMMVE